MTSVRTAALICLLLGMCAVVAIVYRPSGPLAGTLPSEPSRGGGSSAGDARDGPPQSAESGSRMDRSSRSANHNDSMRTGLLGTVIAPSQATLTARLPSRIRRVFVHEGEDVHAGQTLLELDETEFVAQENTSRGGVSSARAQVARAQSGLNGQRIKVGADIETARGGLKLSETRLFQATVARQAVADDQKSDLRAANEAVVKTQIGYDRAKETLRGLEELAKVGGISRSDLESGRAQLRLAQSDYSSAKAQVDRVQAGTGGVPYRVANADKEVEVARSAVEQARSGLKSAHEAGRQAVKIAEHELAAAVASLQQASAGLNGARAARAQLSITSPLSGVVTAMAARAGETAQPASPLATIVSLAGLRVDALVPARLLALFRIGQSASVSVDTAPGRVLHAVVSDIAHVAEPDGRTFRVKFRLLGAPKLLPGQTARIQVKMMR